MNDMNDEFTGSKRKQVKCVLSPLVVRKPFVRSKVVKEPRRKYLIQRRICGE
jgi:hypothetical protein